MSDLAKTQLPSTNTLILERQGSVLKIWFNRPEAKNALNTETVSYTHLTLPTNREV